MPIIGIILWQKLLSIYGEDLASKTYSYLCPVVDSLVVISPSECMRGGGVYYLFCDVDLNGISSFAVTSPRKGDSPFLGEVTTKLPFLGEVTAKLALL